MNLQSTPLKRLGQDVSPTPVLEDLFLTLDREIQVWISRGLATDKLEAIGRVLVHAAETLGSASKAARWLKRPNPLLDGRPLDSVERNPQAIDDELTRIDHGVYV